MGHPELYQFSSLSELEGKSGIQEDDLQVFRRPFGYVVIIYVCVISGPFFKGSFRLGDKSIFKY